MGGHLCSIATHHGNGNSTDGKSNIIKEYVIRNMPKGKTNYTIRFQVNIFKIKVVIL